MNPFRHFRGLKLRGNTIHVEQTGANITVDVKLLKSIWATLKLNSYVTGMVITRRLGGSRKTGSIAFTPQTPGPWYNARLLTRFANLKPVTDTAKADHIFIFDDSTHSNAGASLSPSELKTSVNAHVTDISKDNVGRIFEDIFGYKLKIDPLTYNGAAVQKSNSNGTHDGVIVNCPLRPEDIKEGSAYQKLIDSTFNGIQSEDLRAAICYDDIPVVFHKYKDPGKRFGMEYSRVDVRTASDVFSADEIKHITMFCQKIGLDFGAIDVMRDKNDGRIYIVDVNKTCMPVLSLSLKEQTKAFKKIAASFKAQTQITPKDS